jgi:alkylation response protein AidB-like acyl-CoA dehydrogenase
MHLNLTVEQESLREETARLCARAFPAEVLRSIMQDGIDRRRWCMLADAGVFNLRLPEADGGVGAGMIETVLVFKTLGGALIPGPLVGTHLATCAIDGVELGDIIAIAPIESDGSIYVEHLASLDSLVILSDDGVVLCDANEVRPVAAAPPRPLDPLTPVDVVVGLPPFRTIGGLDEARGWHRDGAMLVAAEAAGIAAATCENAARYALEREQFGQRIGSFQAVKHLLADMLTRAELASVAVEAAAASYDQPGFGDIDEMVSTAKVMASEAAMANARSLVQIHGGMGFAWEADPHLYLKRAWVLDHQFGSAASHARRLAQ